MWTKVQNTDSQASPQGEAGGPEYRFQVPGEGSRTSSSQRKHKWRSFHKEAEEYRGRVMKGQNTRFTRLQFPGGESERASLASRENRRRLVCTVGALVRRGRVSPAGTGNRAVTGRPARTRKRDRCRRASVPFRWISLHPVFRR